MTREREKVRGKSDNELRVRKISLSTKSTLFIKRMREREKFAHRTNFTFFLLPSVSLSPYRARARALLLPSYTFVYLHFYTIRGMRVLVACVCEQESEYPISCTRIALRVRMWAERRRRREKWSNGNKSRFLHCSRTNRTQVCSIERERV